MWKKRVIVVLLGVVLVTGLAMLSSAAIAGDQGNPTKGEAPAKGFFDEEAPNSSGLRAGSCTFDCGGGSQTVPAQSAGDCACICADTCNATCSVGRFTCSVQ